MRIDRTRYLKNVYPAKDYPYQIIKKAKNIKLGTTVTKGRHTGKLMYTVTFEERATCPTYCKHWYDCYGNTMPFAHRIQYDKHTIKKMDTELSILNNKKQGVLIRLHVLGDFPDLKYVKQWEKWLDKYPNISCYGYTAHNPKDSIGDRINRMNTKYWERWSIRFSNFPKYKFSANSEDITSKGIVCPEQSGKAKSCASCGLCWNTKSKSVLFMTHSIDLRKVGKNANSK